MTEKDIKSLIHTIHRVVREDLESLGHSYTFENYFVDEIMDYILQDDQKRIERFYCRLFAKEEGATS